MKPIIIGSGLAGMMTALSLAPRPVTLISNSVLGAGTSTEWAQGGIAAAVGNDDAPSLHALDTSQAGAGLSVDAIVESVTAEAPKIIQLLEQCGVAFDKLPGGTRALGLEAAHSRRRIVHASGAATGLEIVRALARAVRSSPQIEVLENTSVVGLARDGDGRIAGAKISSSGFTRLISARQIVLATGGSGALWLYSTNPNNSWGSGLELAARAGAALADLEFMQFHPTAIAIGRDPMPLASEALRGEGAVLIDENGERFTDELTTRDKVARAVARHIANGHKVYLDTRQAIGARFPERFPSIDALCRDAGIDPTLMAIPVCPAAHYHMGGVVTDSLGRTSIEGLWACGEAACTGLHGANRLASNSLLEAAWAGQRVASNILGHETAAIGEDLADVHVAAAATAPVGGGDTKGRKLRELMSQYAGVVRNDAGMRTALAQLWPDVTLSGRALVATMVLLFALERNETRGAQARSDFPNLDPAFARRQIMTFSDITRIAGRYGLRETQSQLNGTY